MRSPSPAAPPTDAADANARLALGLEAIIDAAAGILAASSLQATLQEMAEALFPIVPYTSLALYEVDWTERVCKPLLATGRYVEETLASRAQLDDSITGSAVLQGRLVVHEPGDPVLRSNVMPGTPTNDLESILVAPLIVGGRVEATLNIWREVENVWFKPEEALLIERFASLAALAYANSTQREQLRTQALTDDLTGLYNRRHAEQSMAAALDAGRRHGEPTSIAYFDIDAFKSINDDFGHAVGDGALVAFADVLRESTRDSDTVCRTGGEEFTIVLPRTDLRQAARLAERINRSVREARLGPRSNMTVSAGVACSPSSRDDPDRLLHRADEALLTAKRSGRDRVIVAGDDAFASLQVCADVPVDAADAA